MFLYVGRHSKSNNFQKRYNYNNRFEMPKRRLELPRPCGHRYLKPARLPIPPFGRYNKRKPICAFTSVSTFLAELGQ